MAILTTSDLGQSFGGFDLFGGISVSIPGNGKIGLVGPNGIGKTTLLLIMAGRLMPSHGTIHRSRGARFGYLPQESAQAFADRQHTIYDEMLSLFADLRQEESRLRKMEAAMTGGGASDSLLESYGSALEQFELAGGYEYELRIKRTLDGLGFGRDDWTLALPHLSGGQKTRLLLARLLLEKPDLLILDEPTNHLDVEAIEWLENTLKTWEGAVLVVSHDRYFLDKVVNIVWEMSRSGIENYRGNYSAYVLQRQERWADRQKKYAARKQRLEKELDYIRRNIAGQRTQMAKGKLSRISRELRALEQGGGVDSGKNWSQISQGLGGVSRHSMDVAEAASAIKRLERPDGRQRTFKAKLNTDQRSGEIVLRTKKLVIGYPGKELFRVADLRLSRQECAAIIGPNGAGKTTFLRTLLGDLKPLGGEFLPGASLNIGYFAQAHEGLNLENRVIDELQRHHELLLSEARHHLAQYLFQGDDVFKQVGELSGGERGRLALAILALHEANFLLLDEPTNHLDIPAQEMLQNVLESFAGTILLVSHDRYLVNRLATQIWHLEEGRLQVFGGNYQEYLADREDRHQEEKAFNAEGRKEVRNRERQARKADLESRRRVERLAELEGEIAALESALQEIGRQIQEASERQAFDNIQALGIEYAGLERQLEARLERWETLAHEQTMA